MANFRNSPGNVKPPARQPHQNVNPQTCDPNEIEVKSPKTRGRQLSIKDISSVTPEPTRGWDEGAATTKIMFV